MSIAPLHSTRPAEDVRRAHAATRTALRAAAGRTADLLRSVTTPQARVPGLDWSAAETAAHMVGELRDYRQGLIRHTNGYLTHAVPTPETPARMGAMVNARQLAEVTERDTGRLAALLEQAVAEYLAAAEAATDTAAIPTANGLVLNPSTMTSLLLGEQVIHGLDIARAAGGRWSISAHDALKVIPGALTVAPHYLRPSAAATHVSFELRIRGANRYRLAVDRGVATVTGATERSDCVITADPVAFMLVGFGRISQWSPILRGKMRAGGRKPWLAMKFATLISCP